MYVLECDRPPFIRISGEDMRRMAERCFMCPVHARGGGDVAALFPRNCTAYVAGPLESFGSIARKFGADAAELKKFNGGEVYASRTIYVP